MGLNWHDYVARFYDADFDFLQKSRNFASLKTYRLIQYSNPLEGYLEKTENGKSTYKYKHRTATRHDG